MNVWLSHALTGEFLLDQPAMRMGWMPSASIPPRRLRAPQIVTVWPLVVTPAADQTAERMAWLTISRPAVRRAPARQGATLVAPVFVAPAETVMPGPHCPRWLGEIDLRGTIT